MVKETISLQTLLNLMEYLEKEIVNKTSFVISNNATLKSKSTVSIKNKVIENYAKRAKCLIQLREFKSVKDGANHLEIDGSSNTSRIYELDTTRRTERFLRLLIGQKSKTRVKGKENEYTFFIPKSELETELLEHEEKISELKEQMSEFNESHMVEVQVDKDLDLI